jgi:hypothetical protein
MTRDRAKGLLPIITAFAEGKRIECKVEGAWVGCMMIMPDLDNEYRIKPEPREWWVCDQLAFCSEVYARERQSIVSPKPEIIHVREVMP